MPSKPLLVFAAAPYGAIGALIALAIMYTPFGIMAFLGVASLIGVIVSHVIVLFDFIEDMHEKGEPLERALPDAGIERIRPVMITVGATILALFPLALEGALYGNLSAMPRSADWLSPPSSHCSVVRSEEFDEHGMARGRSEACIAGDQWRPESLGKPDVSSIVGREIVTELPNSRQERKMGVASDAEV